MVETNLPDFPYGPVVSTVIAAEAGSVFEPLIRSGKVDELAEDRRPESESWHLRGGL